MRCTIKSICCSLCISIPMLSLSIFPSLPFRAVEVLSCDITLHRGKLESPACCFTPLVSSQRICFGHKCSFTTCLSPLSCMLNMPFQQQKIQWLSAESEFKLIACVFVRNIFSPSIDLQAFQTTLTCKCRCAIFVKIREDIICMLSEGWIAFLVFQILLSSQKLGVVFFTLSETFAKLGTVAAYIFVFYTAVYVSSKHPNCCITDHSCIHQLPNSYPVALYLFCYSSEMLYKGKVK